MVDAQHEGVESTKTVQAFGPEEVFDPKDDKPGEFWAEISATDDCGVAVDGLKEGDVLRIIDISGIASFAKGKSGLILSIISAATGLATNTAWKTAVDAVRKGLTKNAPEDDEGGKKRNGYGREIGGAEPFAEKEGGIIVCMPSGGGVVYSSSPWRK